MKRIINTIVILMIITLILSGCGANSDKVEGTKDKEVLTELKAMKDQGKNPKELFDYLNQNISQINKAAATEATGYLLTTLEEYENTYNERLFTGNNPDLMYQYFEFAFDYSKIETIKEEELKALLYDITLGGFKIVDTEGTFMIIVDYEALKTFNDYIDTELKTYIEIMALRFNSPVAIDASVMINPEELENRIMEMESYITSYENQQRKEVMISMYQGYMMVYMSGTDNTAVFDGDTGVINPDMFKAFERAAQQYKDTIFGKVMSKYVEVLKQEGFIYTEKVQDFILNIDIIVNEQLDKLKNA
ncbi:MAG: hypothetical protein K0Q99_2180 [Clostridia bacterium]|jgi:hypothetical protein|nr:hypothetical protein [Clostridia bacterium]